MTQTRRTYTRRQKLTVVGEAEVIGVRPAARKAGVPPSTVEHWRNTPAMAQLRTQKREEVAADVWTAFQLGVRRIVELIPETEDLNKVAVATGIIYDKYALISGQATSRTESLTGELSESERTKAKEVLQRATREIAG